MGVAEFHPLKGSEDLGHELTREQRNFLDWKKSQGYPPVRAPQFYPDGTVYVECTDGAWVVGRDGEEEQA